MDTLRSNSLPLIHKAYRNWSLPRHHNHPCPCRRRDSHLRLRLSGNHLPSDQIICHCLHHQKDRHFPSGRTVCHCHHHHQACHYRRRRRESHYLYREIGYFRMELTLKPLKPSSPPVAIADEKGICIRIIR